MKVNYKSDFELTIQLTAGGVDVAAPSWDWQLRFYTFDRQAVYTVTYIDGKAERCAVNSDGTITAYFDKHGLMPGVLSASLSTLCPIATTPTTRRCRSTPWSLAWSCGAVPVTAVGMP